MVLALANTGPERSATTTFKTTAGNVTLKVTQKGEKNLILPQNSHWLSDRYGERVSAPHPAQHPVVAGETLYSIACVYGDVTPEAIAVQNGLTSADQVVPGMTLSIP